MSSNITENLKVYRFNFRQKFVSVLYKFSKVHQYDSCSDFKDAFTKWEEKYNVLIQEESEYLSSLGYVGDFRNKVFKSARYYFRKKDGIVTEFEGLDDEEVGVVLGEEVVKKTIKKSAIPRKKYTSIDYHLSIKITEYLEDNHILKPSEGFSQFCELYRSEVDAEIKRLEEEEGEGMAVAVEGDGPGLLKIKKTFKNKHFNKKKELLQRRNVNDNL